MLVNARRQQCEVKILFNRISVFVFVIVVVAADFFPVFQNSFSQLYASQIYVPLTREIMKMLRLVLNMRIIKETFCHMMEYLSRLYY